MLFHMMLSSCFKLGYQWAPMQPATIGATWDLCIRYQLHLGDMRQCGMPDTSTYDHHWELNFLILSLMPYLLGPVFPQNQQLGTDASV